MLIQLCVGFMSLQVGADRHHSSVICWYSYVLGSCRYRWELCVGFMSLQVGAD